MGKRERYSAGRNLWLHELLPLLLPFTADLRLAYFPFPLPLPWPVKFFSPLGGSALPPWPFLGVPVPFASDRPAVL